MYKLMIVDDNSVQLSFMLSCIDYKKCGIDKIYTAMDGVEGLEVFEKNYPDIILTDVEMPRMSGVEMMHCINNLNKKVKFIFVSCYDDFDYIKDAMDNDAASYILKPIDSDELEKNIIKAIEEIKKEEKFILLDKIMDENVDTFRENFLYRFLHSSHIDELCLKNTLDNLGFNLYNQFVVAVVEVFSKMNIYAFLDIIKNELLKKINGYAVVETDNRCIIVFMSKLQGDFYEAVKSRLEEFIIESDKNYSVEVSVGLSSLKNTLYDAKLMLTQAMKTLDNCILYAQPSVYCYNGDSSFAECEYEIEEIRDSVLYMLESNSDDPAQDFLLKYCAPVTGMEYMKKICVSVVTVLQVILMERGININELYGRSSLIWDKLDHFETIPDTRRWLYNIVKTTLEFINGSEHNRYEKIVQDIIKNINENYASVSNVNDVIKGLYISTSYAQSIFKKNTGKTISDYIVEKRIEEAKKLLCDSYIKVYEVAERVGYKSKAYFTETFKKYTGITPKEFQQKH